MMQPLALSMPSVWKTLGGSSCGNPLDSSHDESKADEEFADGHKLEMLSGEILKLAVTEEEDVTTVTLSTGGIPSSLRQLED